MRRISGRTAPWLCRSCRAAAQTRHLSQHQHQQKLLDDMRRRTKLIPDYLTPMPSHLLTTTLCDLLATTTTTTTTTPSPPSAPATADGSHTAPSSPRVQSPPLVLPQGHHLVYFPIQAGPSRLAPDGADLDHCPPALGSPPRSFPRRLWAGGSVVFRPGWRRPARLDGRAWLCREDVRDVRVADGGDKVFVDVWRRYGPGHDHDHDEADGLGTHANDNVMVTTKPRTWAVEERRTLVFLRAGATHGASGARRKPIRVTRKAEYTISMLPTATHLFHFSALTFNAHAVHLDAQRARSTDGHRDLLVHGPLTLALMLHVLGGRVADITYRNYAPLYVDEIMTVCVGGAEDVAGSRVRHVWVDGPDGGLAVKGTATMEDEEAARHE